MIGSVPGRRQKPGVFVDGVPAADVVRAIGAEGAGHVHFG